MGLNAQVWLRRVARGVGRAGGAPADRPTDLPGGALADDLRQAIDILCRGWQAGSVVVGIVGGGGAGGAGCGGWVGAR